MTIAPRDKLIGMTAALIASAIMASFVYHAAMREEMLPRKPLPEPQTRTFVPPPLYVPQTGQVLPNLPSVSGAGPGGRETSQDRAMRCVNQAGVYGSMAGDRNTYVGSCINQ